MGRRRKRNNSHSQSVTVFRKFFACERKPNRTRYFLVMVAKAASPSRIAVKCCDSPILMKTDNTHRYRVLLADDQPDIRDALRLLLKNEGYETQPASSPAEALAAIENCEFDARFSRHYY
jgi:hypothetical protein